MSDPWIITPLERKKHDEQFKSLGPINGFITGEQAKGFFLQSRLPPQVLGVIWMLSDLDGDGKMNQNEFSIACKLINLKLRGFNIPQTLPPSLKQSVLKAQSTNGVGIAPPSVPTIAPSLPMGSSAIPLIPGMHSAPAVAGAPVSVMGAYSTPIPSAVPNVAPVPQGIPGAFPSSVGSAIPGAFPAPSVIPSVQPLAPTASLMGGGAPPVASVGPMAPGAPIASVAPIMATSATVQQPSVPVGGLPGIGGMNAAIPAAPLVPTSAPVRPLVAPVTSEISVSTQGVTAPKLPIQDTSIEWGVPQPSKLKYTQVFNVSDKTKSGFLSGAQARNILIQSGLPQQTLATIWALSDVDNDGRLSCEEFVLAMFLCEQAKAGKSVPSVLPADLIPPSLRRSRTSSIVSLGSVGAGTPGEALSPTSAQLISDVSFEDKRRENYEKGQAEIERRRKVLLDAQRRETEERLRREREEEMKREKARQEAERKRQEELEREMQIQRELEAQKEAERKRLEETKEQARKEAERQRQEEWEKQRLLELMNVRQRQQENLLALKAKNQSLTIDLSTKEEKVKELTQKISETRVGVTEVKATIDSMRSTRDNYMSDMNSLKAQARDQNQRLLNLNQEKARLKARSLASAAASGAETAAVEASVTSKQMVIKQLQEKVQELEKEVSTKEEDVNNNLIEFESAKEQFHLTGERCKELYEEFNAKRKEVLALREKLLNPDAAWGDVGGSSWSEAVKTTAVSSEGRRFQALYQFDARNEDELSFSPGDIIAVVPSEGAEPGWLSGSLNNKIGWFPEAYCEELDESSAVVGGFDSSFVPGENQVDSAVVAPIESKPQVLGEVISIYNWTASRNNHLSFSKGDNIIVREKLEDWIFGELNGIGGWFPKTYVKGTASPVTTPLEAPEIPPIPQYLDHDDISQYYVSVYPYQSEEPGDLLFETGETILVVKKEGDWWFGIIGDRSGIFPSNYVQLAPTKLLSPSKQTEIVKAPEEIAQPNIEPVQSNAVEEQQPVTDEGVNEEPVEEPKEVEEEEKKKEDAEDDKAKVISVVSPPQSASLKVNQDDSEAENKEVAEIMQKSPRSPKKKGKKLEVAQVIAPYDATSDNQLSLARGQLVSIRKKTASGWWEGELHARGKSRQVGWFPASYVKIKCGSSRTTPVSMELSGKDEYPLDITPGSLANALSKNARKGEAKIVAPPPQDPEKVEALYPYTAVNDDELSFEPGDIIFVLDKEDSAWWKGSLRGVIGVFPSNYVQTKSEAKIASAPAVISTSVTTDAEDSLCYTNSKTDSWDQNWDEETPSWFDSETTTRTTNSIVRNKRYTTYECFNSSDEEQRQNVIHEIIQTESSYLDDLRLVQKAFINPMKKSDVISEKEIDIIFVNWDDLVTVSLAFNKALTVRQKNTAGRSIHMISDILCQQISQLHPYMRFCSLQSRGSALLNKKLQGNASFADFISRCEEKPDVSGHRLTFFLLKPLQRLTKYPLLIKNLLSYTPKEHPDYQNTLDALQVATTLCEQVNEAVRQQDNTDKLEWMQRHIHCDNLAEPLIFNSLTNTLGPRKLLHMGLLHKAKSKKEIIAFLLSDFLLLTAASKPIGATTSLMNFEQILLNSNCTMYKEPMFLSEIKVRVERDSETGFSISSPKCEISLSANSSNDRNNWLKRIDIAQKHIRDTEKSRNHSNQTKESDNSVVGRVLISVMGGVNLASSDEDQGRSSKGLLKVKQVGLKLDAKGKGNLHSFCEVSLGSQVHRTKTGNSAHPKWNQAMQFRIKSLSEDVLCITVFEKGFFRPNEFLGRVEVKIQSIYEKCGESPVPHVIRLPLQEVSRGEVVLKYSLQLFK